MEAYTVFADKPIAGGGPIATVFLENEIKTFQQACRFVHELPYGYNADRDDPMSLFKEKMGTCTTKHAVIALLARELGVPVEKQVGIYAMTEAIVTGTDQVLAQFDLPYVPMVHCFLAGGRHRVDLTEGNANGKKQPLNDFLYTQAVTPAITAKEEYLIYRQALKEQILKRPEFEGREITQVLKAREQGLALLKAAVVH